MPISGVVRGNSIRSGDALFQARPTKLFTGLAARAHPTSMNFWGGAAPVCGWPSSQLEVLGIKLIPYTRPSIEDTLDVFEDIDNYAVTTDTTHEPACPQPGKLNSSLVQ